jgi:hypothetical protein
LPLLGKIADLPGGGDTLDPFAGLKSQILNAVSGATGDDVANAVADAINALNIPDVKATVSDGALDIAITRTETVTTGTATLDIGSQIGGFLDLSAQASASLEASLNTIVEFSDTGEVSLKDTGSPELQLQMAGKLSPDATAKLGIMQVTVADKDPSTPEISANASIDLDYQNGQFVAATPDITSSAGLDLTRAS